MSADKVHATWHPETKGQPMSDPELVSIAIMPEVFPDVRRAIERAFPGLVLYRMPPEAETPREHVYGIGLRNSESREKASGD